MIPKKSYKLNFKEKLQMARASRLEGYKSLREAALCRVGQYFICLDGSEWGVYRDSTCGRLACLGKFPTSTAAIRYAKENP